MTTESFGAAMKRLQSLAGYTSEQLDTLKEAILSMSANERDTHFQGSSHFLLQEMSQRRFIGDDTSLQYEEMQTLIAQFAYDLVEHTFDTLGTMTWTHLTTNAEAAACVPDLTE